MSDPTRAPRVRFAPSPTGYLHVGGARTALFNWLWARKHGGQFLLRIEDTDKARSTDESTRAIFEGLEWLGLPWDEEVVYQGANLGRHQADARRLVASGHAYLDFTTPDELERMRQAAADRKEPFKVDRDVVDLPPAEVQRRLDAGMPYAIRFRVPDGDTAWEDLVHGRISFPNKDIEDFVILRSDGTPLYNHAVVSDDIAMRITLVMRGDDHISNTPKQILLYRALGAELPAFGHLPMIHGLDGKKLSKRHGATAVADWQHEGILPQAMCNFLALLGWSPGGDVEVMALDEMVQRFSADGLLKKAAVFDPKKLEWMNGQHLSRMPLDALLPTVERLLEAAEPGLLARLAAEGGSLARHVDLARVRARRVDDIVAKVRSNLRPDWPVTALSDEARAALLKAGPAITGRLGEVAASLGTLDDATWADATAFEARAREVATTLGLSPSKLFQPIRCAATGSTVSGPLFDELANLGRAKVTARLTATAAFPAEQLQPAPVATE